MSLHFLSEPWFWVVMAAASELIGMSPWKENSVVQVVLAAINKFKPPKKQ